MASLEERVKRLEILMDRIYDAWNERARFAHELLMDSKRRQEEHNQ